jgi:putative addiction module component (TIGR02574 family)
VFPGGRAMDRTVLLDAIKALPVEDRQWLVQEVLDTMPDEDAPPAVSPGLRAKLDGRLAELRANPEIALTWDQVKARLGRTP